MGEKKLEKIKSKLAFLATEAGRVTLGQAMPIALELVADIRKMKGAVDVAYWRLAAARA